MNWHWPWAWADLYPKYAALIAGFAGAVVQLSFAERQSSWRMIWSVAIGTIAAAYCTPLALAYFQLPETVVGGIAFLIGLTAMNLAPNIMKFHPWFLRDPAKVGKG